MLPAFQSALDGHSFTSWTAFVTETQAQHGQASAPVSKLNDAQSTSGFPGSDFLPSSSDTCKSAIASMNSSVLMLRFSLENSSGSTLCSPSG